MRPGQQTLGSVIAYLSVFIAAAATTFLLTPLVRKIVIRAGAVDRPNDRKVHPTATPTMGGIAMYGGLLAGLFLSRFLPFFKVMNLASPEPVATLVTATLIVALGVVDDKRGISALTKFTGQIFVVGVLVLMGVQLLYFWFPGPGIVVLGQDLARACSPCVWVVVMVNAVNLVDGLDGLAAGMVAIAASAFFIYVVRAPSPFGTRRPPRSAVGDHGRGLRGLPAVELPPGQDLHGRFGVDAARPSARRSPRSRASGGTRTGPAGGTWPPSPIPCWCRCSSCPSRSSTSCSRSSGGPGAGTGSATPTRSTSITG